jgi:hypothetical protein
MLKTRLKNQKNIPQKDCCTIYATTFFSRLQITFIRLFAIRQTAAYAVELVLLDAREFKEPCAEKWTRQRKERRRYEMIHFFAILNRIKILPGTTMEMLRNKTRFRNYENIPQKDCCTIYATTFFSRLQITFIRLFAIRQTEKIIVELVLLDAREFKKPRCREMGKTRKRRGKIRNDSFLRTFESN